MAGTVPPARGNTMPTIPTFVVIPGEEWSLADTFTSQADAMTAAKRYAESGKDAKVYRVIEHARFDAKKFPKPRPTKTGPTKVSKKKAEVQSLRDRDLPYDEKLDYAKR